MNRTLMEKARSMLSGARLEQKFWAKAIATTCYVINRSPTSSLVDKTPIEAWSGQKPSLRQSKSFWVRGICSCAKGEAKKIGQQSCQMYLHRI